MLRLRMLAREHPEVRPSCCRRPSSTCRSCGGLPRTRSKPGSSVSAGVSQSNVIGGLEDELQVIVDPRTAGRPAADDRRRAQGAARRTTTPRPATSGKANAATSSARSGSSARPSRSSGSCLRCATATPVYVRDVAEVQLGLQEARRPGAAVRRVRASPSTACARPAPTCWT